MLLVPSPQPLGVAFVKNPFPWSESPNMYSERCKQKNKKTKNKTKKTKQNKKPKQEKQNKNKIHLSLWFHV